MRKRYLPSPRQFRWLMNFFPPLLVNGVWATSVSADFRRVDVRIRKNRFNSNFAGGIWGGALLAAADPWHGMLLFILMNRAGIDTKVASTALQAEFIKAARTSLTMVVAVTEAEEAEAIATLQRGERYEHDYHLAAVDRDGEVCFRATVRIYLRRVAAPLRVVAVQ